MRIGRAGVVKILLFMLGSVLAVSCFAKDVEVKGTSLVFEVNDKKITASAGGDTYTFRFKNGRSFILSPAPDIKPDMMEDIIKKSVKEMEKNIRQKKTPNLKIKSSSVLNANLGIFIGREASVATIRSEPSTNTEYYQCTYIFLFWDGKMCWKGSYDCAIRGEAGIIHNILRTGKRIK